MEENENLKTGLQTLKRIEDRNTLRVFGYCPQFKARLTRSVLVFPRASKQVRVESFGIVNEYSQDLEFYFLENSPFFQLKQSQGVVKKNSVKNIKVFFNQKVAGNYWKRLHCVIRGHWLLQLDCFASVDDYLRRPMPIGLFVDHNLEKENWPIENISGLAGSNRQSRDRSMRCWSRSSATRPSSPISREGLWKSPSKSSKRGTKTLFRRSRQSGTDSSTRTTRVP